MKEYLAFVEKISDEVYSFQFCKDPEVVWGLDWNICPSSFVPGIKVDNNCITSLYLVKSEYVLNTAGTSSYFSMQDCIDGIIPLVYSSLEYDVLSLDGEPFKCSFGETIESVKEKLDKYPLEIIDHKEFIDKKKEIMDGLLDDLDEINGNF